MQGLKVWGLGFRMQQGLSLSSILCLIWGFQGFRVLMGCEGLPVVIRFYRGL